MMINSASATTATPPMSMPAPDSFLPLTPVTFHILLALLDGPHHGYGVKRIVEERTDNAVSLSAGTLYTAVQRLDRSGLIEEVDPPGDLEDGASSRWRFYTVTALGREVVAAELSRLEADVRAARAVLLEQS